MSNKRKADSALTTAALATGQFVEIGTTAGAGAFGVRRGGGFGLHF